MPNSSPTPPHTSHSKDTQKSHAMIFLNNCIFKKSIQDPNQHWFKCQAWKWHINRRNGESSHTLGWAKHLRLFVSNILQLARPKPHFSKHSLLHSSPHPIALLYIANPCVFPQKCNPYVSDPFTLNSSNCCLLRVVCCPWSLLRLSVRPSKGSFGFFS